jgi:ribosome-associated protein
MALDVTSRLPLTDVFVLATGLSERQVDGIVDAVEERLLTLGAKPVRREGKNGARWVLLDYGEIVVHVLHAEDRDFYALEKLWKDCPEVALPGVGLEAPMAAAVGR